MSDTLLQETDFTAYRCCVCGDRVEVKDADIGTSSICFDCAPKHNYNYIPIPWSEWVGNTDADAARVNVRRRLGKWT
jgi:hypothetical protein